MARPSSVSFHVAALACLAFCTALPAQLPAGAQTAAPSETIIPWAFGSGGKVRSLDCAFWKSATIPSMFGVRGTTLARAVAPAVTKFVTEVDIGVPVVDCVCLPGAGAAGRDAMLVSVLTSDDLHFLCSDGVGGTIDIPFPHPGWMRATMMTSIVIGDVVHVAARSQNGMQLLRTSYDRTQGLFTQHAALPMPEAIRDLAIIDDGDDGLPDVVVLSDAAMKVYDLTGIVLRAIGLTHPGGAIESTPQPVRRGAVTLLRRNAGNNGWELLHMLDGVQSQPAPVTLDTAEFTLGGFSAGDMNGDGYCDVAVQDAGFRVRLVRSAATATHFEDASTEPLLSTCAAANTQGPAQLCDYDYDGCADLATPFLDSLQAFVGVKFGLRSAFAVSAERGQVLNECFFQDGDKFELKLGVDESSGFDSITVTYYTGIEDQGGVYGVQTLESFTYDVPMTSYDAVLDAACLQTPHLLFFLIQFHDNENPKQKPMVFGGATVDLLGDLTNPLFVPPNSAYLQANQEPGTTRKPVKKEVPPLVGRQQIGWVHPVVGLPLDFDV